MFASRSARPVGLGLTALETVEVAAQAAPDEAPFGFTGHWLLTTGHYSLTTRHSPIALFPPLRPGRF
jgi:hypothetical protein